MASSKKLLLTLATGEKHKAILAETIGQSRKYAKRIGADFKAVTTEDGRFKVPHYQKLLEIAKAALEYERVCFIDADVLISDLAPDIFNVVPDDSWGLFNEAPWVMERHKKDIQSWLQTTGCMLREGTYYNTGVLVTPKGFKFEDDLLTSFILPNHYGEQTYFNQYLLEKQFKVFELEPKWNRMSCTWLTGWEPYDSYFVHFAGQTFPEVNGGLPRLIRNCFEDWKKNNWQGGQKIMVVTGGGMGNQIATLPVIAEIQHLHPEAKISIHTPYEEVFEHLEEEGMLVVKTLNHDECATQEYSADLQRRYQFARVITTLGATPFDMTHMNSTDYHSITALGRQIVDKRIRVPTKPLKTNLAPNTVVIHAGKNAWKSKDVPEQLYQDVCSRLKALDIPVAIIGKKEFTKHGQGYGAYRLTGVDYDFLDSDFATTCEVIRQGAFLLTNDSAPAHIAGAFDNWIGLISIAKHPDLIYPYRPVNKNISFTAPEGKNLWELAPRKAFYFPHETPKYVADWVEGMEWPKASEIVEGIMRCLSRAL